MASSIQELEFLDLTDIDEAERNHLQQVLYTNTITPNLELPWSVQNDIPCSSEFEPATFAVAPIPHPSLRGVFLPQPLYTTAPAAVAVGLVPSATADATNTGVSLVPPVDGNECSSNAIVATTPGSVSSQSHISGSSGESGYSDNVSQVSVLSVPPPVPTSVSLSTQPVITTMYQMMGPGMPLSNVYVSNVTANVSVHSFVGTPLTPYSPHLPQQVYSPGDVPVPHEPNGSPNTGRNGIGRRLRTNKASNKRVDGQFGPRTTSSGHAHEVIPPSVVESPTGPPHIQPQNYMIPVAPLHPHPFHQQTFYPSAQPPHGGPPHIPQHPSAQHATGTPIFLPSVPQSLLFHPPPLYNPYTPHPPPHQPPAGAPIVYSPNPSILPAPVSTAEQPSGTNYQAEEGTTERMLPEGRETEINIEQVQQTVYNNVEHFQNSLNGESKTSGYHDSDVEVCNIVSTVVVNNSNIVTNTQFSNSNYSNGTSEASHVGGCKELGKEYTSVRLTSAEKISVVESKADGVVLKQSCNINRVGSANVTISELPEKQENINTVSQKLVPVDKQKFEVVKTPSNDSVPPTSSQGSNIDTSSNHKSCAANHGAMGHQLGGSSEVAATALPLPATSAHPEKTWASLFNKSDTASSLPSDSGMVFSSGMSTSSVVPKPLAAVRPFQNAVSVMPGTSDASRKAAEVPVQTVGGADANKSYPHLGQAPLPVSSMTDDPCLYRLGELLSKYQLDHRAISLQPRGLTNRSNWCYINSTLQALLACPPFYNLMKSLTMPSRRGSKSSTPIIDSMVQFVTEFLPLSPTSRINRKEKAQRKDDAIEVQAGAAFEPNYIYKMLSNIQSDTFKVEGRQEDAEEFFSCLLNALNDEMLELIKLVKDTTEGNLSNGDIMNGDSGNQNYEEDDTEWKVMGRRNKGSVTRRTEFERTPVSDIFRGQLRSRVQHGGGSSDNVQPFFTLQLDIEKAQSVKEALDLLVGKDQLEGVTCSRTNQEVEAWQQVTLEELPLVLVLHLKWFNYKMDGCSKIVKTVDFPIDLKVDNKLLSSGNKYNAKQKQYKLFAVVYHDGKEATKGHYLTDVYHVGYGGWVRYDDSTVKAIQENQMLHPRGARVPYLLYYRRCDTIGNAASVPDKGR